MFIRKPTRIKHMWQSLKRETKKIKIDTETKQWKCKYKILVNNVQFL